MRIPVVDNEGKQLMPCTPTKARHLLKSGEAKAAWSKLGIFYIKLTYSIDQPNNQTLVVGVDPGSNFEGYSVVGTQDSVLNIMSEASTHVKKVLEIRKTMRKTRRNRNLRRRPHRKNRLCHTIKIPPSTRSRWEAKARVVAQLCKILPLTDVVVEDVKARVFKGKGGQWAMSFSPIQVGKEHLYYLLQKLGLTLHKCEGHQTADLRVTFGLTKTKQKDEKAFSSHCVDSWVMAASVSGAIKPTEKHLYYMREIQLHRRRLHKLQPSAGGFRKREGSTRSLGLKRGTLVKHPKYGLTSVGGTQKGKISLHAYTDNKRLDTRCDVADCYILTFSMYRSRLIGEVA